MAIEQNMLGSLEYCADVFESTCSDFWRFESALIQSTEGGTSDTIFNEAAKISSTEVVNLSTSLPLLCCTHPLTIPAAYSSAPDSTICGSHPSSCLPQHLALPTLTEY